MTELLVSTSPRSTWLWAADESAAEALRTLVRAAGAPARPVSRYGAEVGAVTDVGIGAEAYEACAALERAGYSFAWHPDQYPANRRARRLGVPVAGSLDE